jgi:hypothetical protein
MCKDDSHLLNCKIKLPRMSISATAPLSTIKSAATTMNKVLRDKGDKESIIPGIANFRVSTKDALVQAMRTRGFRFAEDDEEEEDEEEEDEEEEEEKEEAVNNKSAATPTPGSSNVAQSRLLYLLVMFECRYHTVMHSAVFDDLADVHAEADRIWKEKYPKVPDCVIHRKTVLKEGECLRYEYMAGEQHVRLQVDRLLKAMLR